MASVSRGIAWYGVGHFVPAVCTLGLASLVGNVLGDTEELGEFWLLFGVAVGAANTVPKWLQQAILRWGPSLARVQFAYFLVRIRYSWCISAIVAAASVYAIGVITGTGAGAARAGAAMYAFSLSSIIVSASVWQAERRASAVAGLRVVDGSITFVGPTIGIALGSADSTSALLGLAVLEVSLAVVVFRRMAPKAPTSGGPTKAALALPSTRALIVYGAPMCFWLLANQCIAIADRYIVDAIAGTVSAGRYASTYVVVAGMAAGIGAPIMTWFHPEYMSQRQDRDRLRRRVSLILAVCLGSLVIATPLLDRVLDSVLGFDASVEMAVWLAAGAGLYWVALARQKPLEAHASLIGLSFVAGFCAVANIVLSVLLVHISGSIGAARATFATYLLYLLLVEMASMYRLRTGRSELDTDAPSGTRDQDSVPPR